MKSALQDILEGLNNEFSFTIRSYSGRGMYGKSCLAVTTNHRSLHSLELGAHLGRAANDSGRFDEVIDAIAETREDSMGLGSVMYWPSVPYVEDGDEGDYND